MWETEEDNELLETNEVEGLDEILEEMPRKRTRRKKEEMATTDEYVNKNEMWQELYSYYMSLGEHYDWDTQTLKNKDVFPNISNSLTNTINDIATKMGHRANFCGYSYLSEMIGDAILKMVKAVRDCSFKCYTVAQVISTNVCENIIMYYDKKGVVQTKPIEDTDEYYEVNGMDMVKFKANPFGYFSRITTHSYLNRIKKEKTVEDTKRAFQEETWEKLYSNENFRNVRRPKIIESDENDGMVEE
jgi:hypothetical protein